MILLTNPISAAINHRSGWSNRSPKGDDGRIVPFEFSGEGIAMAQPYALRPDCAYDVRPW